jgi:acetyltransferase-like isoleucine patch superfamily enzyme
MLLGKKILSLLKYLKFRNKVNIGKGFIFSRTSAISISAGSTKGDIIIGDKLNLFGRIISQNGGKVVIQNNVQIGPNSIIGSVNSITIGEGTVISNNVVIMDNNNHPVHPEDRILMQKSRIGSELRKWKYSVSQPIDIGKNVWIGQFARVNKGVTIGDNSIVAAMTVVTKDVPCNSIVAGNPGKVVKTNIEKASRTILND